MRLLPLSYLVRVYLERIILDTAFIENITNKIEHNQSKDEAGLLLRSYEILQRDAATVLEVLNLEIDFKLLLEDFLALHYRTWSKEDSILIFKNKSGISIESFEPGCAFWVISIDDYVKKGQKKRLSFEQLKRMEYNFCIQLHHIFMFFELQVALLSYKSKLINFVSEETKINKPDFEFNNKSLLLFNDEDKLFHSIKTFLFSLDLKKETWDSYYKAA